MINPFSHSETSQTVRNIVHHSYPACFATLQDVTLGADCQLKVTPDLFKAIAQVSPRKTVHVRICACGMLMHVAVRNPVWQLV